MSRLSLRSLLATALAVASSQAAAPLAAQAPPPTCRLAIDSLDAKVRANYAGFLLEVKGARRAGYDALLERLRDEADGRPFGDCFITLRRLTDSFDDPHLFVFQSPSADSAAVARRRTTIRTVAMDEAAVRRDLDARRRSLDPIEGIWYDGPARFAVVRDAAVAGRVNAFLLGGDGPAWPAGAERGHFTREAPGRYDAVLVDRDFGERRLVATLHRHTVLRLSPGMWGKAFPVPAAEHGLIDSVDVHRPRLVVRERSVVVTMPSHDGRFTRLLDSLVASADTAIRARRLLIIDLRGNEGGGSLTSRALHPY